MENELNYLSERIGVLETDIDYYTSKLKLANAKPTLKKRREKRLLESILNYIKSNELKNK